MGLSSDQKKVLNEQLEQLFEDKVKSFTRPTGLDNSFAQANSIPERDRRIMSAVHSWSTSFGQQFYEPIAKAIALSSDKDAHEQWESPIEISQDRVARIDKIVAELGSKVRKPDVDNEIKEILSIPNKNLMEDPNDNIVDVYFDKKYLFDIKTVGPNKKDWIDFKKMTLKWSARMNKRVYGAIAIPYNPKAPRPYASSAVKNYMQVGKDVLVAADFWDLIGGRGCYEELGNAFKKIGSKYWEKTLEKAGVK